LLRGGPLGPILWARRRGPGAVRAPPPSAAARRGLAGALLLMEKRPFFLIWLILPRLASPCLASPRPAATFLRLRLAIVRPGGARPVHPGGLRINGYFCIAKTASDESVKRTGPRRGAPCGRRPGHSMTNAQRATLKKGQKGTT